MKKLALVLIVVLFTSTGIFAQQRQRATPEERAKRQTENIAELLTLTKEQKDKVYEINLKCSQGQTKATREDRDKRKEEMQKMHSEKNAAINAVLTKEQQTKFEEYQKNTQNGSRRGRPQRD